MDLVIDILLWGALAVVVIYIIKVYNNLVVLKRNTDKAWSNIDVLLKQRYDEIPKLVKTVKGYMKHEKSTIVDVIKARGACIHAGSVAEQGQAENMLSATLGKLFALSEKYPELKANENFAHLQSRITHIENQIADRREFYNDSVNVYNIRIHQLPDALLASFVGYKDVDLFRIASRERQDVDIDF
ncbi:MAG: LemA family protein [Elusimicrobia bacterium CG03_land_8_20_14_0_80_50_18]|nr:MAG: LemA family protein [Elusimicrobia bacterium CG03_land_8_20_14_0_80_50_18]PIX16693.1 MAG: LemA family protein [Elusimicrobia bacterium CG_4_8_14_3_um_filter_50_9]